MTGNQEPERTRRGAEPVPRRRRRSSPTESELLDKAFKVFLDLGYEGASVDAIAAAVGVTKRTLYRRHIDKENLFKAVLAQAIQQFVIPIEQLRAAESEDLRETLLAVGQLLVDNILSPSGLRLLHLTNSIAWRMPEMAASNVYQGVASTMAFLTDLIERRIGDRLLWYASAHDAATAFINLVVCGPATWITQGVLLDRQFVDRYVAASIAMFLHGSQSKAENEGRAPAGGGSEALMAENQRLKVLLAEAVMQIDALNRSRGDGARARAPGLASFAVPGPNER